MGIARKKKECGVGYAYRAVVRHEGGTTIGSASKRGEQSSLSVFLEYRNRILFVKRHFPKWYAWTMIVTLFRALEYLAVGSLKNLRMAYRGILAGWTGQTGRPDNVTGIH